MTEREKQLTELVEKQARTITLLEQKVDYLIRKIYGSSSEKLDADQLHLAFEEEFAKKQEGASEEESTDVNLKLVPTHKKRSRQTPKLPENLPVDETTIIPDEVKANPDDYIKVGEKITDKLDMQQPSFNIKRTIRPVFTKKASSPSTFSIAPLPPSLLEKSLLSPSLLSHILCAKYCDHLPLYRQEQIMARRYNIHIARSTLCDWVEVGANWLEPLYKLIAADIRTSSHIQIDETPVDYLDKDGSKKQGYFWIYGSRNAGLLYDWTTGREGEYLNKILTKGDERFRGIIQCDGYSGYVAWSKDKDDVHLGGCWVHARRYFFDAKDQHPDAIKALQYIAKLYQNEHQFREWIAAAHHPPEAIGHYRKRYSRSITKELQKHLKTIRNRHLPSSKLGKAITYALNQWQKLGRTLSSGYFELDNNKAENAVRPLKLGAKNWLFIGSDEAGWRSAVIYTMIENIRSQGKDPYAYLKWVFEQIPAMTNQDDLRRLLPKTWLENQRREQLESQSAQAIAV